MANFAHHFHLHPWDIDRLTIGEFEIFAASIDELKKSAAEAQRGGRR